MESIVENLHTESIPRLRLGIAPNDDSLARQDLVEFVLSSFSAEEEEVVAELVERAADACESWLATDTQTTMSRFNR